MTDYPKLAKQFLSEMEKKFGKKFPKKSELGAKLFAKWLKETESSRERQPNAPK